MNASSEKEPKLPTVTAQCPVHGIQDFILNPDGFTYSCPIQHEFEIRAHVRDVPPGRSKMEGGKPKY